MPLTDIYERHKDGRLQLHWHPGQERAWDSTKRIVLVLAGWQSGKTLLGPAWLYREIQRRGPGDYLIASPTYPLMLKKVLPEFLRFFQGIMGPKKGGLGDFVGSPKNTFTFSDQGSRHTFGHVSEQPTQVFFGHAGDPNSLESATVKAAWLDEAGQKGFRLGSYETILGRCAIHQGRVLITTRPYDLGWLKTEVYDRWQSQASADIDVVHFRSIDNPAFPRAEYDRARATLPLWKFLQYYDGCFERPAGLIYDCFDATRHVVPRFAIEPRWQRYVGLDFGGINTCAIFFAEEPGTRRLFAYREYLPREGRTVREHVQALLKDEPMMPIAVGGSRSEQQWRDEFAAAGLPVRECPIIDVEVGIQRVYAAIREDGLFVFADLAGLLDEFNAYSRELDEAGNVTEKIDQKEIWHRLDACRYLLSWHHRGVSDWDGTQPKEALSEVAKGQAAGVFMDVGPNPYGS